MRTLPLAGLCLALTACDPSVASAPPTLLTASPSPSASPANSPAPGPSSSTAAAALSASPTSLSEMQTGNATFSLTEAGYRGSYTVVSSAPAAVSAVSPVAATSDTTTVTVDALAAGSANLTVTDRNGQSVVVAVGVTLTPVAIQGVRR